MRKTGVSILPLHYGHPPPFLYRRMVTLGGILSSLIIEKYGSKDFLHRLSDPFWFHSLSLAIGFDWNSSGTTTTTMAALKEYFQDSDSDVRILGGKGTRMSSISPEFTTLADEGFYGESGLQRIRRSAKAVARVDSNLLDDGYDLYMQFIALSGQGKWSVIQQGLDPDSRTARRYHWSDSSEDFMNDGREGISSSIVKERVSDLSTRTSSVHRDTMVDIVRDNVKKEMFTINRQSTLDSFEQKPRILNLDIKVNWRKMRELYEYQPSSFEELFNYNGVGKSTIRALSYLAEIVYGSEPSFQDPVKFSFALGGKDGIPKPVDYYDYDKCIEFYTDVLGNLRHGDRNLERIATNLARAGFNLTEAARRR